MSGKARRREHAAILGGALAVEVGLILLFAFRAGPEGVREAAGAERLALASFVLFLLYALYVELRVKGYARALERSEALLRQSEERYALAVRGAKDGIWDWDVAAGRVHYSPRWKAMLGYRDDEIGDSPEEWFSRVHEEDRATLQAAIASHVLGHVAHFECEYRIRARDGSWRWMLSRGLAVRNARGEVLRMAGSQTDITDRKDFEERLARQALYDPLTGLPNRTLFFDRLAQVVRRARRDPERGCAVLFVDLDHFKEVNDRRGHAAGDRVLVEAARRLERAVRPGDTVARLGGDEFTVLLEDISGAPDAVPVAERLRAEFERPFELEDGPVTVTASIGIAAGTPPERAEDLLRNADRAMYRAKELGRARFALLETRPA